MRGSNGLDSDMLDDSLHRPSDENLPAMKSVLLIAGIYNLVWGLLVVVWPNAIFSLLSMEAPKYPEIWQCVGMVVGVYGVGYLIAAGRPLVHWPIVLVGLLGKFLGPLGFLFAATQGRLPWSWGYMLLANDLIWWVPFAWILVAAYKKNSDTSIGEPHDLSDATVIFPSSHGRTLSELSHERVVMLVFLRHLGCTFCREALRDLAQVRDDLESMGVSIALVHMSRPDKASSATKPYGLNTLDQFDDGSCEIYRAFGVGRGKLWQLLGPKVIWRGLLSALSGNSIGPVAGDAFRMPAVFFMYQGEIHGSYRHQTAADRPKYRELAEQCLQTITGELQTDGMA